MKDMDFETQLRSIASGMEYPPTPDIAGAAAALLRVPHTRSISRIYARSVVLALVLLASLLLIPSVRAAVLEFIQIGVVRIFRAEPTPIPQESPATMMQITATPSSTLPSLLPVLEQMAGETTLQHAEQMTEYPILLPAYPAGLG